MSVGPTAVQRYAILDANSNVVNVIMLRSSDLGTNWNPPAGCTVVQSDTLSMPAKNSPLSFVTIDVPTTLQIMSNTAIDTTKISPLMALSNSQNIASITFTGTSPNQVLNIVTQGLTSAQKTALQTWCNTNLGAGKVVIS